MILFSPRNDIESHPCIILFGAGLIGNAIASQISTDVYNLECCQSFWGYNKNLSIHEKMIDKAFSMLPSGLPLEIIWGAGKAGFSAGIEETRKEFEEFKLHLDLIIKSADAVGIKVNFTLLSSAGGIFEGQRLVDADSVPSPQRPYGHLKLDMEKKLQEYSCSKIRIIRLTSVFGYIRKGQRRCLISTLIENGLKGQTTSIYGTFDTLRDYVFVEDVASFILQEIFSSTTPKGKDIVLLTSGKPNAIGEIVCMVEQSLKRKLLLKLDLKPTNLAHISYRAQDGLDGFRRTPISIAINKIYHDYLF